MTNKNTIRKQIQTQRDSLSSKEKNVLDTELCNKIIREIEINNHKTIHTYLPIKSEINIFPVVEYLLKNNKTVVAPKALADMKMSNLILSSLDQLENGAYGTKHPAGSNEYHGKYDLIIVPGLAFDKNNNRIGYGAGYYDSFLLDNQNSQKIALAYPFQVFDNIPSDPHDIKIDKVIY